MELLERFRAGDRRALARAISWVENGAPEGTALIKAVFAQTGRAHVVGVTGPPGAGKSTLVDRLAAHLRAAGKTVGVVAVDPSSPFTGGAILGDRIRMQRALTDPGVFVRSLASRGHLGGISVATGDVVGLLDAFGFDVVVVETVGAGQSEVEIMGLAHTTVVVLVPGMGDDIQAIKAGILEIGNVFAVNKADREGADRAVMELEMMLDLAMPEDVAHARWDPTGHHADLGNPRTPKERRTSDYGSGDLSIGGRAHWRPPVLKTVAKNDEGVGDLVLRIQEHLVFLEGTGRLAERRLSDAREKLTELVTGRVAGIVLGRARAQGHLDRLAAAVARRESDPYSAADELLARHFHKSDP